MGRRVTLTLAVGTTATVAVLLLLLRENARTQLLAALAAGVVAAILAWTSSADDRGPRR